MNENVVLIVKDGWGYRSETDHNLIAQARTPFADSLQTDYPFTTLQAAGLAVGVPAGTQGNSEIGHMTIGSGRIIDQPLTRINRAIADGSFFRNQAFLDAIAHARQHDSQLHLIGLAQDQGVHAHIDHLFALLDLCAREDFQNVNVHVITDGRDALPEQSCGYIQILQDKLNRLGFGRIATICGRYYAMDREAQWERTQVACEAIIGGDCVENFDDPMVCVEAAHSEGQSDEFLLPKVCVDYAGIQTGDAVIFWNFRTDRARQLTQALVDPAVCPIYENERGVFFVAMTKYYDCLPAEVAFPDDDCTQTLGQVVSAAGAKQLRISETTKYAHVTHFFNCKRDEPWPGEERVAIETAEVKDLADNPRMQIDALTKTVVERIGSGGYRLLVLNFPNADMVGHTGNREAMIEAIEAVDQSSRMVVEAALAAGYSVVMTADHGNAELVEGKWANSHTLSPVPCHVVSNNAEVAGQTLRSGGGLQDIAPTVLDLMGVEVPEEMTGRSLLDG